MVEPPLQPAEVELVQALQALQRPNGPVTTANIPEQTRALPMAHVTEHPFRAIEAALSESAAKKPSYGALAATLASPLVLCAKSLVDLAHGVTMSSGAWVLRDPIAMAASLGAIVVGGGATGLLYQKWYADHQPSKLHELATKHVGECLTEMQESQVRAQAKSV